jgi:hypothetical protein
MGFCSCSVVARVSPPPAQNAVTEGKAGGEETAFLSARQDTRTDAYYFLKVCPRFFLVSQLAPTCRPCFGCSSRCLSTSSTVISIDGVRTRYMFRLVTHRTRIIWAARRPGFCVSAERISTVRPDSLLAIAKGEHMHNMVMTAIIAA